MLTLGSDGVHFRAERVRLEEGVRDHLAEVAADIALHHLQQAALVLLFSHPKAMYAQKFTRNVEIRMARHADRRSGRACK